MTPKELYIDLSDGTRWYPHGTDNRASISVIAHGLGNLCRFTGHCKRFYSVAEHSVKVSYLVPTLTALLHDAHEVIINDLASPTKRYIGGTYVALEKSCEQQLAAQYHLEYPHPVDVKRADTLMVLIEAAVLLPGRGACWYDAATRAAAVQALAADARLKPQGWAPPFARNAFIKRYLELGGSYSAVHS